MHKSPRMTAIFGLTQPAILEIARALVFDAELMQLPFAYLEVTTKSSFSSTMQ